MKKIIKVCLIGAGRIGFKLENDLKRKKPATHFGMWIKNKNVKLCAICDKNKISKNNIKKFPSYIKIYKNFIKMIKIEKPDIVSIATWKDSHFEITSKCIDLGIRTIVLEKPLSNNIKEAIKLRKKIKKKKVNILINHRRRFDTDIINLRKKLNKKIIGNIINVNANYVYGILTTGTHLIDTLRMLLKDIAGEVDYVSGYKNKFNNFCPKDDQNIDGSMVFKNGLKVSINSLSMKSYDNFDIFIYGTKGLILITGIGRTGLLYKVINSSEHTGFRELSLKPNILFGPKPRNQFGLLSKNAVECFLKRKKSMCNSQESLIDMIIIDNLIKSAKQNSVKKKISIPKI